MANDMTPEQLFTEARSFKFFSDSLRWARISFAHSMTSPNSLASNSSRPMRITFVDSPEGKEKVLQASMPGNVDKIKSAPVTAIIAYDMAFFENYPRLAPHMENPPKEASLPRGRHREAGASQQLASGRLPDDRRAQHGAGLRPDVRLQERGDRRTFLCRHELALEFPAQSWLW